MRIAYVTRGNPDDVTAWSGLEYFIAKALEEQHTELHYISDLKNPYKYLVHARKFIYKMLGKRYSREHDLASAINYAKQIKPRIDPAIDVVFSPSSLSIAYLETNKLKVFFSDATFANLVNYYWAFTDLSSESLRNGHAIEQQSLNSCSLAIYSSEWAAQSAINDYNIAPEKIKVVPFGANINTYRNQEDIKSIIENKSKKECHLLFLAVEWERKGGDIVVEIARLLNEEGIKTTLHIVGIKQIPITNPPSYIKSYGFVSKENEEGVNLLESLMMQSHFLILPSKADCTPVVFSEACSYGLPSLSTKTGGIPNIIKDDINGFTFPLSESPAVYAAYIAAKISAYDDYKDLSLSSFNEYQTRLNWTTSGKKIITHIKSIL